MNCYKCGQPLIENSSFCENCGAPINEEPPKREPGILQSNQQGIPSVGTGTGIPNVGFVPDQQNPKKSKKPMGWIILIVLIIIGCLCVAGTGGVFIYLRNKNLSLKDLVSNLVEDKPGIPEVSLNTPIPEGEVQIDPQVETPETQNAVLANAVLVVTNSGIWAVNEQTNEAIQISYDQVDAPSWNPIEGMSPDKKYFSYITGLNGASVDPMLVVLDIKNMKSILQLELTGPSILPGMEGTHGDPTFEAFRAIEYDNSLAWSPDGTRLAFIAARDGDSADVYLFNPTDMSVSHLSDEDGHAADLHWSPDGQVLQYVSVNTFGTGAGSNMESLWGYDFKSKAHQLLQVLDSNGENFLAWTDNSHFLINSWSRLCESYNLRLVNVDRLLNQTIVDGCFTGSAYDPEQKAGFYSVTEFNYENCTCGGEPNDAGLRIFGEGIGYPIVGEIGVNKFEELNVYNIGFIPQGNLFTFYGDEGLQYIYYKGAYGYGILEILPEVKGFVPYPSPTGDFWVWASRNKTGLWVTENNSKPVELSSNFSGVPLWSLDGQIIYFYENDQLFSANAPQYDVNLLGEFPGEEILGVIK